MQLYKYIFLHKNVSYKHKYAIFQSCPVKILYIGKLQLKCSSEIILRYTACENPNLKVKIVLMKILPDQIYQISL